MSLKGLAGRKSEEDVVKTEQSTRNLGGPVKGPEFGHVPSVDVR
ncbi:MAG: hypothetical protein ACOCR6_02465 [archaeon]